MLSIKRGVVEVSQSAYRSTLNTTRSANGGHLRSKIPSGVSVPRSIATRYYARWAKVVSRMSPAQLAKLREQSNAGNRSAQTSLTIRTSNSVGDPWLAPRFSSPFAGKFWSDMMNWGKHMVMTYIASPWRIRSVANQFKLPKITGSDIRKGALETYVKYNQTLSKFQLSNMNEYVSDAAMKELKAKFGKTVLPTGSKPVWEHKGLKVSILNNAVLQAPAPLNMHFIQATVSIKGSAKFAVFDSTGKKTILGSDEFKPIEDIWVIEKILERPESPWIIVSTHLKHPDDVAAAESSAKL